jgi:hypothetical protein
MLVTRRLALARPLASVRLILRSSLALLIVASLAAVVRSAEPAVAFDGGDLSAALLGPGTGVIVGIVDSGVNSTHPLLAGTDSLGRPRLVAQANFVPTEPSNTGADVYGHGTAVAGLILGNGNVDGQNYDGMAPDARYVNARVLDSSNGFNSTNQIINGLQFALSNGSNVINLSLATFSTESDGLSQLDLAVDYIADTRNVLVTVADGNNGTGQPAHSPGAAANALTMGALTSDYSQVAPFSDTGPTSDGRMKPNMVAPGTSIVTANVNYQSGSLLSTWSGTSFAAPQAAGLAAQMIDYGQNHGLSTDTRVLRAVMMNAADKSLGVNGTPWSNSPQLPLDLQQGTGRLDAVNAAHQYMAGDFNPGTVPDLGWSLHTIHGSSTAATTTESFSLASVPAVGTYIDATLIWNQHVTIFNPGLPGVITPSTFFEADPHDELDLYLYRDGVQVASSISSVDTLQYIHFFVSQAGDYQLRIAQPVDVDNGETYSLAWSAVAVPEPGALVLILMGTLLLPSLGKRRRQRA